LDLLTILLTSEEKGDRKYTIGGKALTVSQLRHAVNAASKDVDNKKAPVVVDGNRRALALVLLAAIGVNVTPNTDIVEGDHASINIASNEAQRLALLVTKEQRTRAALLLASQGKISCEADLQKLGHKRGMAQLLWQQCRLAQVHGLEPDTICTLPGNKEDLRKLADMPTEEVLKVVEGAEPAPQRQTALSAKAIAKLIPLCKTLEAAYLLEAIVAGNTLAAESAARSV
jgi:hypothetical protein